MMKHIKVARRVLIYYLSKLLHQKKPVSLINLESTINEREIKWFKSYDSITVNRNKPLRYGDSEALFGSYPTSSFQMLVFFGSGMDL